MYPDAQIIQDTVADQDTIRTQIAGEKRKYTEQVGNKRKSENPRNVLNEKQKTIGSR